MLSLYIFLYNNLDKYFFFSFLNIFSIFQKFNYRKKNVFLIFALFLFKLKKKTTKNKLNLLERHFKAKK